MYLDFARRCAAFAALACCTLQLSAADKPKVPPYYAEQPATEHLDLTMYQRIREEGFAHSHVMEFASALMDGIGPRLTGSPNMKKANEWTRDTLTKIGLQNAHLEDWGEFGIGWQQINSWARIITPDTEPLWLQAAPWSPATKGPITGDVVHLAIATDADLDAAITKYKGKLSGKIVLFGIMRPVPDITAPLFSRYTDEELKEMEGSEQATPRVPRPGAPTPAERLRTAALRAKALKMMTDEGVAVILTPRATATKAAVPASSSTTTTLTSSAARRTRPTASPSPTPSSPSKATVASSVSSRPTSPSNSRSTSNPPPPATTNTASTPWPRSPAPTPN